MTDWKRYFRFFIIEKQSRRGVVFLLFCVIVVVLQVKIIQGQKKQLIKTEEEKWLVSQIPHFQEALRPKEVKIAKKYEPKSTKIMVVRGIINENGKNMALINNSAYSEGDYYGDYEVLKITKELTVLRNSKTQEMQYLRFSE